MPAQLRISEMTEPQLKAFAQCERTIINAYGRPMQLSEIIDIINAPPPQRDRPAEVIPFPGPLMRGAYKHRHHARRST
jgi:hypothetical protein